jgi:hypothetical protein
MARGGRPAGSRCLVLGQDTGQGAGLSSCPWLCTFNRVLIILARVSFFVRAREYGAHMSLPTSAPLQPMDAKGLLAHDIMVKRSL